MKAAEKKTRRQRGRRRPGRRAARRAILIGLVLAPVAVHLGCTEKGRYQVLSFFFDGVPPPRGEVTKGSARRPGGGNGPGRRPRPAKKPPKAMVIVSRHKPHEQRKCFQCHATSITADAGASGGPICRQCHKGYFDPEPTDWTHGPAAAGDCSFCHKPHESPYEALLTAGQPDLCLRCHDAGLLKRAYHRDADKQACSTCHDPHAAGNRLLLADARTYKRSRIAARAARSTHAPWKNAECSACHVVKEANRIVDDINGVCRSCHEKVVSAPSAQRLHAPVRRGKCILCHHPHKSPQPNLRRPAGQAICYTCHKAEDVNVADHPRVSRVDCLLCHAGHAARREHLLKSGIPSGRGRGAIAPGTRGAFRPKPEVRLDGARNDK